MPALYRKYRSGSFSEVLGQAQVTDVLEASLRLGNTAHGYLFVGPHGVGKTSVARILAFAINQLDYHVEQKHIDIIEIDAASNTGVDNIRDLIEKAQIAPSLAAKKIYIIDEVHMLSKSAFNALLKLLEEPPAHVVFILATTEEQKIPATIASRMQKFVFRKIPTEIIARHLTDVAKKEGVKIDSAAIQAIAETGGGSMRDSISLFDQISNLASDQKSIDETTVRRILGLIDQASLNEIIDTYLQGDFATVLQKIAQIKAQNLTPEEIALQLAKAVEKRVTTEPSLILLLGKLLEISKSTLPELALTTALFPTNFISTNTSAFADKPAPKRPAEVKITRVAETVVTENLQKDESVSAPKIEVSKSTSKKTDDSANEPTTSAKTKFDTSKFDWVKFITTVTETSKPIAGYIKKATYQIDGTNLKIILRSAFEKKTIDAPTRLNQLHEALVKLNFGDLAIETMVDQTATQANKKTSDIIQFMGGGEEVKIDGQI